MTILTFVLAAMSSLVPNVDHSDLAGGIASVVETREPLFAGDESKERTAAFMVAIAYRESTLRQDAVGDKGKARCAFQLWAAPKEVSTDSTLCASIAYDRIAESMRICGRDNLLGVYLAGPKGCRMAKTRRMSSDRLWLAGKVRKSVLLRSDAVGSTREE